VRQAWSDEQSRRRRDRLPHVHRALLHLDAHGLLPEHSPRARGRRAGRRRDSLDRSLADHRATGSARPRRHRRVFLHPLPERVHFCPGPPAERGLANRAGWPDVFHDRRCHLLGRDDGGVIAHDAAAGGTVLLCPALGRLRLDARRGEELTSRRVRSIPVGIAQRRSSMKLGSALSRRSFLLGTMSAVGAVAIAACGGGGAPAATSVPTSAPAAAAPAAAPTPTTAPAAAAAPSTSGKPHIVVWYGVDFLAETTKTLAANFQDYGNQNNAEV